MSISLISGEHTMAVIELSKLGVSFDSRIKVAKVTVGAIAGDVLFTSQTTKAIFNVPSGCLVLDMWAYTRTAWTTSVTINIGDGDNTSGWLATAKVAPTSAQSDGLPKRTTLATAGAFASSKLYQADDTIDVVLAGATPVVGETDIYVMYIPVTDDQNM